MQLRKPIAAFAIALGGVALTAAPAFAHDCFNPTKDAHAPTAGVNYTITSFNPDGPVFEQTGPGHGIGGFVAIAPSATGAPTTFYVHTLGNSSNGHEEVGGPGSQKAVHACNGKGIDYLDACFGG
jgi:hypothetical protein